MVATVDVDEAKAHFSNLLERVLMGEEVVLVKAREPVAKLVPIAPRRARTPGGGEGVIMHDDFFDPLPTD